MIDLSSTVSTLLMYAKSGSQNWQEQANTTIHAYLAHNQLITDARNNLCKEFAKVNPGTERSNAIQDMMMWLPDES